MSIELRSLGRIEIAGPGAEHPEALLSRPLNVAVLAYLLLGGQGQASGALSENRFSEGRARGPARGRESVVTLFWPHASRERGRSSLRVALHALRSHLGPDAIRSRGDDLVVDPDILSCDALAFDDLLRERRLEEALTLYGGDLLPGLRPRCAPRFDAWLADRRLALRRRAAEAAWDLSEQSERAGRTIEAARWARRAAALSPDVEPSARRLMRLLARHGDRVGALEAYDAFVDRWSAEQEAAPSARTRTLAAAIRGAPAMAGLDARPESPTGGGELPADRWPVAGKIAMA